MEECITKYCIRCKEENPIECYHKDKNRKDGLYCYCKFCVKAESSAYYASHSEEIKKSHKIYILSRKEKLRDYQVEYVNKNREKIRIQRAIYRAKHKEDIKKRDRAYRKKFPEKMRFLTAKKRARKRNAPINDFTAQQWREMQEHYQHRCVYCKKRFKGKLTQDHITPLSKGGNHTIANIVPACQSCNSRKNARGVLSPVQPLLCI